MRDEINGNFGDGILSVLRNKELLLWCVLIAIFLLVGVIGHDPWWKKGETYSFGIIYNFYKTGTWLLPMDAGVPFLEKPPLYYWTSRTMCDLFGTVLPLHDAARLASVLYMIITVLFLWLSSQILLRSQPEDKADLGWTCICLFLGTYGIVISCHAMITDLALMAGTIITIYGMSLLCNMPKKWKQAGIFIGMGMGITFMSKGFVMPAILGVSAVILSLLSPGIRWDRTTSKAILLAMLVASPFCLIWPALLYNYSFSAFMEWFWANNVGRFLGFSVAELGAQNRRYNFLLMLPIFAFPVFPLACVEIIKGRREWQRTDYLLPLIILAVGIIVLFFSASFRTIYLLPLIPVLSLLAVQGLLRLPENVHVAWNKIARIAFTLTAIGIWIVWWNLLHPPGNRPIPWLVRRFDHMLPPYFMPHDFQTLAFLTATVIAALWIYSFRIRGNSALGTARILFTGAALIWCTSYTLLMPWINETRSFRGTVENFRKFVSSPSRTGQCTANYMLGENMAPMIEYFMHRDKPLPVINDINKSPCPLVLTFALRVSPEELDPHWKLVWKGTRLLDIKSNELRLYERIDK